MLEYVCYFGDTLIFEGPEGVDFWGRAYIFVVTVVVLDALWAERFDASASGTKVGEGLPVVLHAGLFYELSR